MLNRLPAAAFLPAAATHADRVRRKGFATGHVNTDLGNAVKPAPRSNPPWRTAGPAHAIPPR